MLAAVALANQLMLGKHIYRSISVSCYLASCLKKAMTRPRIGNDNNGNIMNFSYISMSFAFTHWLWEGQRKLGSFVKTTWRPVAFSSSSPLDPFLVQVLLISTFFQTLCWLEFAGLPFVMFFPPFGSMDENERETEIRNTEQGYSTASTEGQTAEADG